MGFRVLILGGYGNFGARIARTLARDPGFELAVAGRDAERARAFAASLGSEVRGLALDAAGADLESRIAAVAPRLVIHTAGPFQQRDYAVARAAIAIGAHYVDLADSREFVCGIAALDRDARAQGVLVASGASTVPALSGAVVEHFRPAFAHLASIEIGISPGNRTPRGLATVAAILASVGRPFAWWERAAWRRVFGWQRLQRFRYDQPVGPRWLAACDVPDLALLPLRYPGVKDVRCRAGLQLKRLHLGLWFLSWLSRARLVRDWSTHALRLKRMSEWFEAAGSDAGAMHVALAGTDTAGSALRVVWQIVATGGDGPQIPCTAAVVLARKLARGTLDVRGAQPCLGLVSLTEFFAAFEGYAVTTHATRTTQPTSSQPS